MDFFFSLTGLFCQTNNPNAQNIKFTIMENQKKMTNFHILEPGGIKYLTFSLKNN